MRTQLIHFILLSASLGIGQVDALSQRTEEVRTDAGRLELPDMGRIKQSGIFHHIKDIHSDGRAFDLENGSQWNVSNGDILKGWGHSKNLVITQNHAGFSTSRFALLNIDLKQAEPISLLREPTPTKENFFVKRLDQVNHLITLNDDKKWIIHADDRGKLSKISENDRIIIGVNTGSDKDKSPYLLIDTANNQFVRAHIVE
jgi:hypothetical protein